MIAFKPNAPLFEWYTQSITIKFHEINERIRIGRIFTERHRTLERMARDK